MCACAIKANRLEQRQSKWVEQGRQTLRGHKVPLERIRTSGGCLVWLMVESFRLSHLASNLIHQSRKLLNLFKDFSSLWKEDQTELGHKKGKSQKLTQSIRSLSKVSCYSWLRNPDSLSSSSFDIRSSVSKSRSTSSSAAIQVWSWTHLFHVLLLHNQG